MYSRLFKFRSGPGIAYAAYESEGDLAESYELADDQSSVTVKLRQDIMIHPPISRQLTSADVKASWERYLATSQNAGDFGFVGTLDTPDDFTLVFNMNKPSATLIPLLTSPQHFWVMPAEAANGGFDPEQTMVGTGPWVFEKYDVSSSIAASRFAEWHGRGPENLPYLDGIDWFIIPEYASRDIQFRGGNLDLLDPNANDLLQLKQDKPDVQISGEFNALMSFIYMSGPGDEGALGPNSLFKDDRVRRAISMGTDRDTITDVTYNVKNLQAAGFDAKILYNSCFMPAGMGVFWLDPLSAAMGEATEYYKFNPKEANAMLDAAGFPREQSIKLHTVQNVYGSGFDSARDLIIGYLNQELGMNITVEIEDYGAQYITQTFTGNFEGLAYGYQTPFTGPEGYVTRPFTDNPANSSKIVDPELVAMVEKQSVEFDPEARIAIIHDIQRYASNLMYYVPHQNGAAQAWVAAQPYVRNYADYITAGYGPPTETDPYIWLDT